MAKTSKERQSVYRNKMREKGYIQTTVFIPKAYKPSLITFVRQLREKYEK